MRPPIALLLTLLLFALPREALCDPPSLLDRAVVRVATSMAIERAGLDPEATRALASRARNAAWLPQVSVRVARNTGASTTQYAAVTSDRQLLDDSLFVDVRVSFSFDRLVFDPRETAGCTSKTPCSKPSRAASSYGARARNAPRGARPTPRGSSSSPAPERASSSSRARRSRPC